GVLVSIIFQRSELPNPINGAAPHRGPVVIASNWIFYGIFAVAMTNSIFGKQAIAIRIGILSTGNRVARVPVKHEVWRLSFAQKPGRLRSGGGIARKFIFQIESNSVFAGFGGGTQKLLVHGCAIRRRVVKSPKIEATDTFCVKSLCQLDAALQHFILLIKGIVRAELVMLQAELRLWRSRPIHFEQRTGNIGDSQLVSLQDAPRLRDLFGIELEYIFVPHAAQFDPSHAKFVGHDFAGTAEILRDLIVNDRNLEGRFHRAKPSLSSRYFLLIIADSFGVLDLSGS